MECAGEDVDHFHPHHMQTSQPLFPSSVCAAAIPLIYLLEDVQVNSDGVAGTYVCCVRMLKVNVRLMWRLITKTLFQKRSDMVRVVEESYTHAFIHERNEPYLPLPSQPNEYQLRFSFVKSAGTEC